MRILALIKAIVINILFLSLIFFSTKVLNKPTPLPELEEVMPAAIVDETQIIKQSVNEQSIFEQQQNLQSQTKQIENKIISAERLLKKTERRKQQEQNILEKILEQKAIEAKKLKKERKEAEKIIAKLEAKEAKLAAERAEKLAAKQKALKQEEALQREREAKAAKVNAEQIKEIEKILQGHVSQFWIRPRGFYGGLSCMLKITIQIGGVIEEVEIVTKSGNIAFDHSAKLAVENASPLPIPDELFTEFKIFKFRFSK